MTIVTVRLQVSDTANCPITLSDYNPTQSLVKDKAVNATIKFEEIVMGMIKDSTVQSYNLTC